jgi:hypothetical protein
MLEDVSEAATTELAKGTEQVNTKEFGDVVDMIKDLTEAEKNKWQSCYYKSIVEAMEDSEYGEDYDWSGPDEDRMGYPRMRDSMGRYTSRRGYRQGGRSSGRRNYDEMMMEDPRYMDNMNDRMYYSNGAYGGGRRGQTMNAGSRYGYSHDEYMQKIKMHNSNDPETMKKRAKMIDEHMDDMYEMFKEEVADMSPEEKQMWKSKLNKIINL